MPFLHLDRPYCYLGIEITASLDWTHQVQKVKRSTLEKGQGVLGSLILPKANPAIHSIVDAASHHILILIRHLHALRCPHAGEHTDLHFEESSRAAYELTNSYDLEEPGMCWCWCNLAHGGLRPGKFGIFNNALIDMGPLGQSTKALLKVEQKCIRCMPTMGTELQDKRFLKCVKSYHIIEQTQLDKIIWLAAPIPGWHKLDGTDIDRFLNTVKLGEISVPSRVYIPLMEIGLLGLDQCTTLEGKKECFILATTRNHSKDQAQTQACNQQAFRPL